MTAKPRESSPLGMTGGIYLNAEAERYSATVEEWEESGYDRQVMIDAGYWAPTPGEKPGPPAAARRAVAP